MSKHTREETMAKLIDAQCAVIGWDDVEDPNDVVALVRGRLAKAHYAAADALFAHGEIDYAFEHAQIAIDYMEGNA